MQSNHSARAARRAPALLSLAIAAAMMAPAPAGAASAYNPETGKTARYITYDPALAVADKAATIAAGLRAPGTITYDREGVPVIQAANDLDAAYLLGYAHARDRFFQMDYFRRVPSGTLAELVGPAALANDVQLRTLGLRRAACATWVALADEPRGILKAYADGVNFWLATNPLPPEYGALETHPGAGLVAGGFASSMASCWRSSSPSTSTSTSRSSSAPTSRPGRPAASTAAALFFEDTHRIAAGRQPGLDPGLPAGAAARAAAAWPTSRRRRRSVSPRTAGDGAGAAAIDARDNPWIAPTLKRRARPRAAATGGSSPAARPCPAPDPVQRSASGARHADDLPRSARRLHDALAAPMNVVGVSVPGTPAVAARLHRAASAGA